MNIILIALLVAAIVAAGQIRKYMLFKKHKKSYEQQKNIVLNVTPRNAITYILQILPIIACLAIGLYVYINRKLIVDADTYLAASIMFAIIFSSSILTFDRYERIYYCEKSFIIDTRSIYYKSVRCLTCKKLKAATIELKDNNSIKITRKTYKLLKELIPLYNKRVKIEN